MQEIKILLSGAMGRLGRAITESASESGCRIVAGIDVNQTAGEIPVYQSPLEIAENISVDCIINCSFHSIAKTSCLSYDNFHTNLFSFLFYHF